MDNIELVFSKLRGAVSSVEVLACSLEFLEMDKCQSRCAWFVSELLYTLIDQLEECFDELEDVGNMNKNEVR